MGRGWTRDSSLRRTTLRMTKSKSRPPISHSYSLFLNLIVRFPLAKSAQRGESSNFRKQANICGLFTSSLIEYMNGVIKRLTDKGFGFITPEGAEKDVFFHVSALVDVSFDDLREGDKVTFDTEDSDKGPRAVNVKRADDMQMAA